MSREEFQKRLKRIESDAVRQPSSVHQGYNGYPRANQSSGTYKGNTRSMLFWAGAFVGFLVVLIPVAIMLAGFILADGSLNPENFTESALAARFEEGLPLLVWIGIGLYLLGALYGLYLFVMFFVALYNVLCGKRTKMPYILGFYFGPIIFWFPLMMILVPLTT